MQARFPGLRAHRIAAHVTAIGDDDNAQAALAWRGASLASRDCAVRDLLHMGDCLPHTGPHGSRCVPRDAGEPALEQKVIAAHRSLTAAGIAHAFGGVLALGYYGEPRTTVRIELHSFAEEAETVRSPLAAIGVGATDDPQKPQPLWFGSTPVDLACRRDALGAAMSASTRLVPLGAARIPILAPEHLALDRAISGHAVDWLYVEQILVGAPETDRSEVSDWLDRILGADDPRSERFQELCKRL